MFTFGLNFNFFYLAYERRWKEILKDEELKWYIYIILGALAIISFALIPYYDNFFRMIHDVLFNIVSIMSTIGVLPTKRGKHTLSKFRHKESRFFLR